MQEKTVQELKQMLDSGIDFQLVDVRETYEHEIADIGGDKIPMGQVQDAVDKFSKDKPVVIYCRSGARSGNVCGFLEGNHGFTNVFNLRGGILAWADQIDSNIPKY